MQIKVTVKDGCAQVQKINPAADEAEQCVEEIEVPDGSEVTVTAHTAHEPGNIEFGEVTETEE